ncbi:winged helix-turn-helix domain-containing protein [Paraburkholderia acidicola]|uniref:Winged helix-turn-helix domain-containing protein n=1 Tax=Paraburkholderia acidicola TaxID=1912599 RepID=A0ABV1LX91_9BURK|nr:winged helix-turn-helix domain-containing protein [Paraburkholderia acidicola]
MSMDQQYLRTDHSIPTHSSSDIPHRISIDTDRSAPEPRATHTASVATRVSAWQPDFALLRGNIRIALADQIEQAVRLGVLRPGDLFRPQREIADALGFHRNTINAAFREAARRGLVRGSKRRGTVVLPLDEG